MNKLKGEVGNFVTGDKFWDRVYERKRLTELIKEGANILITGQRRMGKTSLIREVSKKLVGDYICLQIDVEKCSSPEGVVTDICVATLPYLKLHEKIKEIFHNVLGTTVNALDSFKIDEFSIKLRDGLSGNWQEKGHRVISALAESEKPVVIFIDEFPLLITRMLKGTACGISPDSRRNTDIFLSWIRSLTIEFKDKIRFVLTGSIGLEPILRQAGLSANINTFASFEVNPWDKKTAAECLQALANRYGVIFRDDVGEEMANLVEYCIPHHIQMFFSYILDDCRLRQDMCCDKDDARRIFNAKMLSTRGHAELNTYEERLKIVIFNEEDIPLALDMLTEAAVVGKLTPETAVILAKSLGISSSQVSSTIRSILQILFHDGYLKEVNGEYVFVSKLLRTWWKSQYEFQFIPARDRSMQDNAKTNKK